jgi:hypothetical protein
MPIRPYSFATHVFIHPSGKPFETIGQSVSSHFYFFLAIGPFVAKKILHLFLIGRPSYQEFASMPTRPSSSLNPCFHSSTQSLETIDY